MSLYFLNTVCYCTNLPVTIRLSVSDIQTNILSVIKKTKLFSERLLSKCIQVPKRDKTHHQTNYTSGKITFQTNIFSEEKKTYY